MQHFKLSQPLIIEVKGPDARRYLNARLTNDIKKMSPNSVLEAAALNPQGRIEGFFQIICIVDDRFLLTCSGGDHEQILIALMRYKVADRVEFTDLSSGYFLYYLTSQHSEEVKSYLSKTGFDDISGQYLTLDDLVYYTCQPGNWLRFALLAPKDIEQRIALALSDSEQLGASEQTLLKIMSNEPRFPDELGQDLLFSEAGLDRAVSFTKGCYVGQEVVEKVDARGRSPRILIRLEISGDQALTNEAEVVAAILNAKSNVSIGQVLSVAFNPTFNRTLCFAVVKNIDGLERLVLSVDGLAAKIFN